MIYNHLFDIIDKAALDHGLEWHNTHDEDVLKKSDDLEKNQSQINFKNLHNEPRPEQNVRTHAVDDAQKMNTTNKLMTGYKDQASTVLNNPGDGLHDPYKSNIAVAMSNDSSAPFQVESHEGHHKVANTIAQKHGLEKATKLYQNALASIDPYIVNTVRQVLSKSPAYSKLFQSKSPQHQFAAMQEIMNHIRDLSVGSVHRSNMRDNLSEEDFKSSDSDIKKAWQGLVNFAKNATKEHMK